MKRRLFIFGIILISFVFIISAILLTVYFSEIVQMQIINFAIKQYNKTIQGEIQIDSMSGNIFQKFKLHHVSIHYQQQEIIHLKRLSVQFNPEPGNSFSHFKNLKNKLISVSLIELDSLYTNIILYPDSSTNISKAFEQVKPYTKKKSKANLYTITLPDIKIINTQIYYHNLSSDSSQELIILDLNLQSSLKLKNKDIYTSITDLSLKYSNIPVSLKKTAFEAKPNYLSIDFNQLKIGDSHLSGRISQIQQIVSFIINAKQIDTHDINHFANIRLKPVFISLKAKGRLEKDKGTAQLNIKSKQGNLDINIQSLNLKKESANVKLTFNQFNPLQFTHSEQLNLDGQADISIQDFDIVKSRLMAELNFKQIKYQNYELSKLFSQIEKNVNNGQITLFSKIDAPIFEHEPVELYCQIILQNLLKPNLTLNQRMNYEGEFFVRNLNPGILLKHEILDNILDSKIQFKGQGLNPESADLKAEMRMIDYNTDKITGFDTLNLMINKQNKNLSADLNISNLRYDSLTVSSFNLFSEINTDFSSPIFIKHPANAQLLLQNIHFKENHINSLSLSSHSEIKKESSGNLLIHNMLNAISGDSLSLNTNFSFNPLNFSKILISELDILYKQFRIKNESQATLIVNQPVFAIENLKMKVNDSHLNIDARYEAPDKIQAEINIKDFNLSDINSLINDIQIHKGNLNWDLRLDNTLEQPLIRSELSVNNLLLKTGTNSTHTMPVRIDNFLLKLDQDTVNTSLNAKLELNNEKILLSGILPLYINQKNITTKQIPDKDKNFNIILQTGNIDLSQFSDYLKPKASIEGNLKTSINFFNTLNDLKTTGQLNINQANFNYPEFGSRLTDINLSARFNPNKIMLDSLFLKAGKGYVMSDGIAHISVKNGFSLDSLDFGLLANQAHLLQSSALDSKLNALLYLKGNQESLILSGRSVLKDTKINIDKLLRLNSSIELTTPLLLQLNHAQADSIAIRKLVNIPQMDNLNMDVLVTIPRNTWIKGKDMNIETAGSVQLKRENKQIILNGSIQLLRGYYALYGKRFDIESANIFFKDNKDFNPDVDIKARYRFRDGNNRRILHLIVNGNIKKPSLTFTLDGEEISEPDAVSYIIFGKNMAQLSRQEQSSVNNEFNASGLATSFLINSLTSKINDRVKDILHLDLVDITGSNQYGNTEIQVGKYFGDRLFVSYLREFNIREVSATQQESMNIEFQITKNFFLQSQQLSNQSSGIDLIFKWEQ